MASTERVCPGRAECAPYWFMMGTDAAAVWESEDWIKKYANPGGAEGQDGEQAAPNDAEADE